MILYFEIIICDGKFTLRNIQEDSISMSPCGFLVKDLNIKEENSFGVFLDMDIDNYEVQSIVAKIFNDVKRNYLRQMKLKKLKENTNI
jgi:hypothetical protein